MFKKLLLSLTLFTGLLLGQNPNTAVYPSSVATDTDLLVAANRASTTLTAAIGAGDLTINVSDTSSFIVPTTISIGSEIIKVCSKASGSFTVCSSGRGFNSTIAVAHASGVAASQNIVAYYFNQLAAEVKAIETFAAQNPMTTLGDTIYGGASGAETRLAGNTNSTKKFLTQTGDGVNSAAPVWAAIVAGDVPTLNQNTTGNANTATALAANPADCATSPQAYAKAIAANGDLTCAQIAYSEISGTPDVVLGGSALTTTSVIPRVGSSGTLAASKITCTATPVTCLIYDDTASTGTSILKIRTGAGQAGNAYFFVANSTDSNNLFVIAPSGPVDTGISGILQAVPGGNYEASWSMKSGGGGGSGDNAYNAFFKGTSLTWIAAGVWNGADSYQLFNNGFAPQFTLSQAGALKLNSYTAGILLSDASGNITASDPADCSSNQYATAIGATGALTCAQVAYTQVTGTPTLYNQTIQDEGSDLTQRAKLNFAGAAISCADDTTKTTCTVPLAATRYEYVGGVCQNATASIGASLPTSNAATAVCVTGSNTQYGVAEYTATGQSIQGRFTLPSTWSGTLAADIKYRSVATTGNVQWDVATICVADAETGDPAFNTASSVTDAVKGTTLQFNDATISSITVTGCAAGEHLFWKLLLNAATTATGNQDLISIVFRAAN